MQSFMLCRMFRVADIRKRTAIAPKIHAVMYTWGHGHTTAEGELITCGVQPIPLHYLDATLLLPVVVEHTIDERSPLYGERGARLLATRRMYTRCQSRQVFSC
jgi:hypothetical protein